MNPVLISDQDFFNTSLRGTGDDTMGFAQLIGMIPSIISLFGGGRKAQFQGLAEINTAGSQATQAMQQILTALQSGQMSPAQAVAEAQKINATFNDPAVVYPAQKGNDAAARTQFVAQLGQALQQIQAAAAAKAASAPNNAATGGVGGISANTLILIGGGLAALMFLKK